jgi:hypothetical protein
MKNLKVSPVHIKPVVENRMMFEAGNYGLIGRP